jgi:CHAT domain-containing protein
VTTRLPTFHGIVSHSPFFTVSIDEVDKKISEVQDIISALPQPIPYSYRRPFLATQAILRLRRYDLSKDERDLETSTLQFTQVMFLPFYPRPSAGCSINPLRDFFCLTEALYHRSYKLNQPGDIGYCLKYLHYLRDPSFEAFGIPRDKLTTLLILTLALRQQFKPISARQDLEEMAVLCRELLASNPSEVNLEDAVTSLAQNFVAYHLESWNQPPNQVIECFREANMRLPDLQEVSIGLSAALSARFLITRSSEDYNDAMAPIDKIISSRFPGDCLSQNVRLSLSMATNLAHTRFILSGDPEYLEEAIVRFRAHLDSLSVEDPERGDIIRSLADLERSRFNEFGVTNGLEEVRSDNPGHGVTNAPSFLHVTKSLVEANSDTRPSMATSDRLRYLGAICSVGRVTNKADIQEAVGYCRLLLPSLRNSPDVAMAPTQLIIIRTGSFLLESFHVTKNPEYLNEAIDVFRGILKVPDAQWARFPVIRELISCLSSRLKLSKDNKDFDEIMELFPIAANDTYTKVPNLFVVSCEWAQKARLSRHPSSSTAYERAMSLLQDSLAFTPTLEVQHHHLVARRDHYERLPLDYASYQAQIGRVKEAIETLERGRSLLWSEMRGFRTSIDQLLMVDSRLAEKFAAVNRDLEALTTSGSPDILIGDGEVNCGVGTSPFGRIVVEQRKLLAERNSLITQIRSLPHFDDFLMSPSYDTLRCAAICGPIVIINHCKWRSDILILLHDSHTLAITMPDDFYGRAIELRDRLVKTRNQHRLESKQYQHALRSVLENLYELVGRPVIEEFRKLNIPEQSRVWWCPTSVFCSLPLHAMGPIPSEDGVKRYFLDLYIPSYTPTLSALIESRKSGQRTLESPSLLLVAQPDESLLDAWPEIRHIQSVGPNVTSLISERATPPAVLEGLRGHQFAHFVCHGRLELGKPFDASFQLHGDGRLTLLDIVRSRLATAEFAFLSACHTAEITEGSIEDESLHLAAAVQYCGFRSVVGTMWAMADMDGQGLVEDFYKSTFSCEESGASVAYYERTARALRDAVKKLRRKRGVPLERWVNFVHYGA